jgi:TetR/AcrR family transcriptional regulator
MPRNRATGARTQRRRRGVAHADVESSRRKLFDAAAREFAAHGFAGTSVDRIAAAARLNKAMIYYHFGSKAGLYGEILRDMFAAVGARVREVAASTDDPTDQIRQFVAAIAVEAEARPHFPQIWFREIADRGVHLDQDTLREIGGVVTTLAGFVDAGVRRGEFHPVDPLLVHGGIVAPLLLFFASRPLRERIERTGIRGAAQYGRDEVVEHIQRVTIDVLRRREAEGPGRADRRNRRRERSR